MTPTTRVDRTTCYLVTGVAGFIGFYVARQLLDQGQLVVGVDSLTDYYDVAIKKDRLSRLILYESFSFYRLDVTDWKAMHRLCYAHKPTIVIHLAAQPGVVVSDDRKADYIHSNVWGFECVARLSAIMQIPLIYASSSSVYGCCKNVPFRETEKDLKPLSLYAQTKIHNEVLAKFYREYLGLKAVGLRFFSIYGEDMRPDLVISKFTRALLSDIPIVLYGDDDTSRDFTYIGDLVTVILLIAEKLLQGIEMSLVYNVGNQAPVRIVDLLCMLEGKLSCTAIVQRLPLRDGEVESTFADLSLLQQDLSYVPNTAIDEGLDRYLQWYKDSL